MTIVCNVMLLTFFLNKSSFLNFFRQNLIAVFRTMEIFESTCFNTWRFKNLRSLNTEIFESSCFNTQRFKNLHELKHEGFVRQNCSYFPISMFQYTEIQKSPCIKHRNFLIFVFQYTEIQKYPCIGTWRLKHFRVLYTEISF